jgi:hypothetical protein
MLFCAVFRATVQQSIERFSNGLPFILSNLRKPEYWTLLCRAGQCAEFLGNGIFAHGSFSRYNQPLSCLSPRLPCCTPFLK